MPKIIVYETQDAVPPKMRFLGTGVIDGKVMPVTFYGASREEVTGSAQDFWIKERLKHRPDVDPWAELGIKRPAAPPPTSLMDLLV